MLIRSGNSPIILRTYLRISAIEQLLYCRTCDVYESRQFEKIPIQQEFYSRFKNCCKLVKNVVQILNDSRTSEVLHVPGAQPRDHSSTLRSRDASLREHRYPKRRGTKSSPTLFALLFSLLFFLVSFQCPLNSGHSSPLFSSFLWPKAPFKTSISFRLVHLARSFG